MTIADQPPSFADDIRPLFRPRDQKAMSRTFDLWSYEDVAEQADAILDRLEEGDMPCDGPWPEEHVALFRRWIDADKPE